MRDAESMLQQRKLCTDKKVPPGRPAGPLEKRRATWLEAAEQVASRSVMPGHDDLAHAL